MAFIAFLSGCQMTPRYERPLTYAPKQWKNPQQQTHPLPNVAYWWEIFNDNQLNCFEWMALHNNYNVFVAFERVVQARALAGIADSNRYPHVNLDPFYANEGILYRLYKNPLYTIVREHRRTYQIPFVVNYEVDLWGKLQKAYEAGVLNLEAQEEMFQSFLLILTTDLASSYFQIRMLDAELLLLERILKAQKNAYDIVLSRYEEQINDYSDVAQAELAYTNTLAQYYETLRYRNLEENKIAVLVGMPASDFKMPCTPLQRPLPIIPAGLPSQILLQRPDIAEAERIIASKYALIGVAYASFFPALSLTGALGFSSPALKDFLSWRSRLWAFGANIFQPIFDAGLLQSNYLYAVSEFRQAVACYQNQIIQAFREVEDALASLEDLRNEYMALQCSVQAAKKAHQIASDKYYTGVTFYLDVVVTEQQVLDAEINLLNVFGQQYDATIQLIKALGGSWGTPLSFQCGS